MPPSRLVKRYRRDESGATAIEYGLLATMLTIALVGIFATGGATEALYDLLLDIADAMSEAIGGAEGGGAEGGGSGGGEGSGGAT